MKNIGIVCEKLYQNTLSIKLSNMFKAGFLVFAVFKDELEARKLFKAFFLQPKL